MKQAVRQIYHLLPEGDLFKIGILFVMMIIASVITLIGVGTVPVFVSAVIDADRILNYPVVGEFLTSINVTTPQELAVFGAFALITIYLFKNLFMLFYSYMNGKFMLNRVLFLQNRIFRAYMNSPYTFYISRNSSELLRNINSEVTKIVNGTLQPALLISLNVITTVVVVTGLVVVEPLITGLGIIFFGGFAFLFLRLTKNAISRYGSESLAHRKSMTKAILEGLQGFKDAKVLKREGYFLSEYNHHAHKHKVYDIKNMILNTLPRQIIEMLALSGILFIAVVMVLQGREVSTIVPMIALFGAAVMKLKPSINSIIGDVNRLRYNIYSVEAVYEDLTYLEERYEQETSPRLGEKLSLNHEIRLKNLDYAYPDQSQPAIKNIDITIPKNKAVAFVGPSGVGKTTLVDVILGLLVPQRGTITVDGQNVFSNLDAWQRNIGYIPQFINLLDDSIRRNICFGIPEDEVDEEMLQTAIEIAQLKDFLSTLDDGVETVVGERGVRLSGGQRQRIGIARALYNNPQVLVMDEATSALDNITERVLIKAIERLRGDRTIIMIAHRLTTVKNCDTIYMMKDGEVIADGEYDELLVNSKEFREMSLVDEV
ncbi:ABC transporter ATP-binding protein [Rhodohalobacter sulfatireducens]|uniref:ABC transporter ATP-binding protein/permease n=1 Tax=Rhodohalobacter sulfatireducens TaxID=2911366 RepID=A0ABS9KJD4_9BACT|nr:ABC transporter ATP-binding protein [Rhodohalobacter sulfatireducens]MCG2590967.1 ABC transporter ATP-binding protein/permease [Rhodohalobacter sulfatireducens]